MGGGVRMWAEYNLKGRIQILCKKDSIILGIVF